MSRAAAAAFDDLYDPRFGIVSGLQALDRAAGEPDWFHVVATTCDPAPLGGIAGRRTDGAAGTTRDEAFAGAIARAVTHYAAALYQRDGLPIAAAADAPFATVDPRGLALFSDAQYRQPGFPYVPFAQGTPVRWASTIDLASGSVVYVPAAMVWHPFLHRRLAGDLPVVPPGLGGLACGDDVAEASLSGLYDVVAADAAAIFWHSMTPPPQIAPDTLPPPLRALAARFGPATRLTLLDVTTDNRIPAVVAALASDRPQAPALAFATAANLDPGAALATALRRLAETRRRARAVLAERPAPSPANDWEDVIDADDHIAFAAASEHAERLAFWFTSDDRKPLADRESDATGSVSGDLERAIARITLTGANVLSANLTSSDLAPLGIAVCRVIVTGYQPLAAGHHLRPLGGGRLFEVPQKLGYRGIPRGSTGNPAPHPFG